MVETTPNDDPCWCCWWGWTAVWTTEKVQELYFAVDLFTQQEIRCDQVMDPHAHACWLVYRIFKGWVAPFNTRVKLSQDLLPAKSVSLILVPAPCTITQSAADESLLCGASGRSKGPQKQSPDTDKHFHYIKKKKRKVKEQQQHGTAAVLKALLS